MAKPPVAAKRPQARVHHGDEFLDDFEWLRDKESPEVLEHLQAENAYTDEMTAHLAELRKTIFDEIKSRTQETDMSVPVRMKDWWYYSRIEAGEQYSRNCRVAATSDWTPPLVEPGQPIAGEQILLDSNIEAKGHDFYSLGGFDITNDGNRLAYSIDTVGDERYTIRVKNLSDGTLLDDEVTDAAGGVTWSNDGNYFFFVRYDDAWRPYQIWRHKIGGGDELVYEETDEKFFLGVGATSNDRFLVIGASSKTTSEMRILDANNPTGEFEIVWPRETDVEYSIEYAIIGGEEKLLITHNKYAKNFQVDSYAVGNYSDATPLVPASDSERIDYVDTYANHVVLGVRRNALTHVDLIELTPTGPGERRSIDFGEELFSAGIRGNAEWDPPVLRMAYTSFITPTKIVDYVLGTGELLIRKEQPILGGYDPADYVQRREWVRAEDGTEIPLSIVHHKDTLLDGTAPGLLYGYGSYEISIDPGVSIPRISLLNRGFVFAIAHIRGGGELGRQWYEAGKMQNKMNSFTDFVACAKYLADKRFVDKHRLIAEGGSAGGLLMGAVANLAPEAFGGIVASVPFVDPLTTILDPSLPLTVIEWDEWGNPLADKEAYDYIKSYSPYENVQDRPYPPVLVITSLHDTRVFFVEPAKWVQKLRQHSKNPVLLKIDLNAGHGGVSGRYRAWEERAFELAWIIDTAS